MQKIIITLIILLLVVTSLLGATVASLKGHPFWYVSRIGAILIGIVISMIFLFEKHLKNLNIKQCNYAVLFGGVIAFLILLFIDKFDLSLVSNRSYGHIIGSVIIVYSVILFFEIFNNIRNLTKQSS